MLTKDFRGHCLSLFARSSIPQCEYQEKPRVKKSGIAIKNRQFGSQQSLDSGSARQSPLGVYKSFLRLVFERKLGDGSAGIPEPQGWAWLCGCVISSWAIHSYLGLSFLTCQSGGLDPNFYSSFTDSIPYPNKTNKQNKNNSRFCSQWEDKYKAQKRVS